MANVYRTTWTVQGKSPTRSGMVDVTLQAQGTAPRRVQLQLIVSTTQAADFTIGNTVYLDMVTAGADQTTIESNVSVFPLTTQD